MLLMLIIHIVFGVISLLSGIIAVMQKNNLLRGSIFNGLAAGVVFSGVGLVFMGGSITRACMSGGALMVALYGLRIMSIKRAQVNN
jgi:hypothetical protein